MTRGGLGTLIANAGGKRAAVLKRCRNGLTLGTVTLNQSAPLHVVEEEGLVPLAIVEFPEGNRAADVEAERC